MKSWDYTESANIRCIGLGRACWEIAELACNILVYSKILSPPLYSRLISDINITSYQVKSLSPSLFCILPLLKYVDVVIPLHSLYVADLTVFRSELQQEEDLSHEFSPPVSL